VGAFDFRGCQWSLQDQGFREFVRRHQDSTEPGTWSNPQERRGLWHLRRYRRHPFFVAGISVKMDIGEIDADILIPFFFRHRFRPSIQRQLQQLQKQENEPVEKHALSTPSGPGWPPPCGCAVPSKPLLVFPTSHS
jgi:hypothetical protein